MPRSSINNSSNHVVLSWCRSEWISHCVQVWMLTGDKLETATSIGRSSKLISKTQTLFTFKQVSQFSAWSCDDMNPPPPVSGGQPEWGSHWAQQLEEEERLCSHNSRGLTRGMHCTLYFTSTTAPCLISPHSSPLIWEAYLYTMYKIGNQKIIL